MSIRIFNAMLLILCVIISLNCKKKDVTHQELKPWHSVGDAEVNREFTTEFMRSRAPRMVQKINNNWTFNYFPDETLDEQPASVDYNDASWPAVAIPHSWHNYETTKQLHPFVLNASEKKTSFFGDESGIGNPAYWWQGWGWYRKSFEITNLVKDKRIFLEFEGVMKYCKVYLNGKYIGDHKGGFNSFYFDITDYIKQEGKNILAVAVRNKLDDEFRIPPMHSGNQTHTGGIYRNVGVVVKNPVYIPFQGSYKHEGGTFVTTPVINNNGAVANVKTWIKNDTKTKKKVSLKTIIEDASHKEISSVTLMKTIGPGRIEKFEQVFPPIIHPKLWSPETPDLYKVRSFVYVNGELSDNYESPLGIRTFEWDYQNNIGILNGKPIHINGTNRTQAFPWVNNAIPEWIDVMDIKDIRFGQGHNFIRPCVHPNNLLMHDLFDQWGMLVNLSAPMIKDIDFSEEIQEQMMREAIRQHRNHPSIVFFSVGNETNDGADSKWIYEEDTTRIIHARKVSGGKGDYVTHDHTNMDMENLLRCTVRGWTHDDVFPENPVNGQHTGNELWQHNQAIIQDGSIRGRIDMPNGVMWMYCDDGADRVYKNAPLKNINPKGWVDLYRIPKYLYFLWQANYLSTPMAFIHPHFWQTQYIGTKQNIVINSNCDEVALFVNNKIIGTHYPNEENFFIIQFENVLVEKGTLKVVGNKQGKEYVFTLPMADQPTSLRLTTSHNEIPASMNSIVAVTVDAVDSKGIQVQGFNNELEWEVNGPATLIGPSHWESDIHKNVADSGCWYITTPVLNLIRSTGEPGTISIKVSSPGLKPSTLKVNVTIEDDTGDKFLKEFSLDNQGRIPVKWKAAFESSAIGVFRKINSIEFDFHLESGKEIEFYEKYFINFIQTKNSNISMYPILIETLAEHFAKHVLNNQGILVADDYNFIANQVNNFLSKIEKQDTNGSKSRLTNKNYLKEVIEKGLIDSP